MSDDTLRKAAALMRERAQAVPESPWSAFEISEQLSPHAREWIVDSDSRLIAGNIGISEDPATRPLAEYIASMDPGVALAVADLLDGAADWVEAKIAYGRNEAAGWSYENRVLAHALAVARAYLSEQS